jgi:hypothetical protein
MSQLGFCLSVDDATIYLPFEGTIGQDPVSLCWQNKGNVSYDETPGSIGSIAGAPFCTITTDGLKGQAWDGSPLTAEAAANVYGWGFDGIGGDNDTNLEKNITNIWSFTICGWIKNGGNNQRIIRTPAVEINYYDGKELWVKIGKYTTSWMKSGENFVADGEWKFFAVTYDGTVPWDDTTGVADVNNLCIYYGTETQPVQLDSFQKSVNSNTTGQLPRDGNGAVFTVGNAAPGSTRPFVGQIDEIRVWAGGPGPAAIAGENPAGPTWRYVLTQDEIEQVRLFDAPVYNCEGVHVKGYGLSGDIDEDCDVDIQDLSVLVNNWLLCNDPGDVLCVPNW